MGTVELAFSEERRVVVIGSAYVFPFPGAAPAALVPELAGRRPQRRWAYVGDATTRLVRVALQELSSNEPSFPITVFVGPHGSGKSLLAHGVAELRARSRPAGKPLVYTGASYARAFGLALETNSLADFRRRVRNQPAFILDDLQRLAGRKQAQEELLHVLDHFQQRGDPIVLTCDSLCPYEHAPPHDQALTRRYVPTLTSHLVGSLTVPLHPLTTDGLTQLALWTAEGYGLRITPSVCRQFVEQVICDALNTNRTPPTAGQFLRCLLALFTLTIQEGLPPEQALQQVPLPNPQPTVSARSIAQEVAKWFSVTTAELRGASRRRTLAQARSIAMYLTRKLTGQTLHEVAMFFHRHDHTTVLHACRQVERRLKTDVALSRIIENLTHRLANAELT